MSKPKKIVRPAAERERRRKLQEQRRAREKVLEAEDYAEAQRALATAFGMVDAEASKSESAPPPTLAEPSLTPAPSEGDTSPAEGAGGQATKPEETEPAKPADAASPRKVEASGEAVPDAEPVQELVSFQIDFDELGQVAAEVTDDTAKRYLGEKHALTPSKRERLAKAFAPALREWMGSTAGKKTTPTDALLVTVGLMYAPALLEWLTTEETAQQSQGLRVVNGTPGAAHG